MGILFLLYIVPAVVSFLLFRYMNSIEQNPKDIIPVGFAIFVAVIPIANVMMIFVEFGFIIYNKHIKPNPSIFSDRWKTLNNWFTHGKATDIH